jgi:hypothetical protein
MNNYETCRECDSETGRAGASEDSLYHSYVGPFCEDCYDDWPDKIEAELAKVRREFRDFRAGQAVSVPEWVKCSDRLPNLGQRVILKSRRVVQNYMPVFDQGDDDYGMGDYFWDFEDINDIDNPLVNFEEDCWMPLPDPPKQEQSQ